MTERALNPFQDEEGMTASAGLRRLVAIFRRRQPLFLIVSLSILALALVLVVSRPPVYVATATFSLDARKQPSVTASPTDLSAPGQTDVDSEVEILRSRAVIARVVRDQKLETDPEFNPFLRKPGTMSAIKTALLSFAPGNTADRLPDENAAFEATVDVVSGGLKVDRAGLTYLITLSFAASTPEKAATIANAFAEAHRITQQDARLIASEQGTAWLKGQLAQLRTQVEAADTELQRYKIANNLLSSQGATLTEQEISTLDQQLALTRAQEAEARARLSTARQQLARGSTGEDVAEALNSPVVQRLREQRAQTSQRMADLQGRYGSLHPEILKANRELQDIDAQIQAEIARIMSNLDAQLEVARQRTVSIESSAARSRGKLELNNRAIVRLNELQRNADAVRTIYEALLSKYNEASAERGVQRAGAHIVSAAAVPTGPSSNRSLLMAFSFIIAIAAGIAAVVLAELLDNGLTDGERVEGELKVPYLGAIPLLASAADTPELVPAGPERYIIEKPLSNFAEALRSLNTSLLFSRIGTEAKVIAVSSSLPDEGKTTTAICLTRTLAMAGKKVILIDCDLRQRQVKRILDIDPAVGLIELLNGEAKLEDVVLADPLTSAMILPVSNAKLTPKDVFSSVRMAELIAELRLTYDAVILDTAPLLLVAESRNVATLADAALLLVRWRKTSKHAALAALKLLEAPNIHLAGVALTQFDLKDPSSRILSDPSSYYKKNNKYYTN